MRIDVRSENDIEKFYAVATEIRSQFLLSAPFFSENKNLQEIDKETYHNAAFFIFESNKFKARAGAYIYRDSSIGYVGWFESHNDQTVCNLVLTACVEFLKQHGAKEILGPINGSTFYNYRFNLTYDMPVFPGDPFQPLYYIKLWESFGFNKAETYITTFSEFPKKEMLGPTEVKSIFSNMGLSLERLTVEFLEEIWLDFYRFLIEVFKGNQHYVPISFDEFSLQMKKFPLVLNGKYSYIVFDKNRKPIAFISALIDVYLQHYQEHKIDNPLFSGKKLILKTIATHPEWQNKRVGTLISNAVFAKGIENGYKKVIIALMMEENISAKGAERKFDSEPEVQYALYKLKNHGE